MKHTITFQAVPRETFTNTDLLYKKHKPSLELYIEQLLWWNRRINLISSHVSRETLRNHLRHSMLLSQFHTFKSVNYIIDTGTGGGLPGIPLAISNLKKRFLLNDIVSKKIFAIKQIAKKINLRNVQFNDKNIRQLSYQQPFMLISKHAFKINSLYSLTKNLPWENMVFYKGLDFKKELKNIASPLGVQVHSLAENSSSSFFKNKAIIIITRKSVVD